MSIHIIGTDQPAAWAEAIAAVPHDFYHRCDYHQLAEERGEGRAQLFVYDDGPHRVVLPLLLRPISAVPGLEEAGAGLWDATSVYGYAGPACSHDDLPGATLDGFRNELWRAMRDSQVVAVFSRMHPLLGQQREALGGLGEYQPLSQTVSIDLTISPEAQLAAFRSNHRRDIRKLRRDGVEWRYDAAGEHLDAFIAIYHETMRRVGATHGYFFEPRYFERLMAMDGIFHLHIATLEGQVICGALLSVCGGICQYHLGGTRDSALQIAPMKLVFDEARGWAAERGARALHLGGGLGSQQDSLFAFKAGFSDRRHDFAVWRWVLSRATYDNLTVLRTTAELRAGRRPTSTGFFPSYRVLTVPVEPELAIEYGQDHYFRGRSAT